MAIGAIIGAGASLIAGASQASAARSAARSQERAANRAFDLQERQYEDAVERMEPYAQFGPQAMNALAYQFGLGPQPGTAASLPQIVEQTIPGTTGGTVARTPREQSQASSRATLASFLDGGLGLPLRSNFEAGQPQAGGGTADRTVFRVGDNEFASREQAQAYVDSISAGMTPFERIERPEWDTNNRAEIGAAMMADGQAGVSVQDGNVFFDPGAGFEGSDAYRFMMEEMQRATERNASARGVRLSGGTLRELNREAKGLASTDYWNYYGNNANTLEANFNRNLNDEIRGFNSQLAGYDDSISNLFRMAGIGRDAASLQGSRGMEFAQTGGNMLTAAGDARAAGALGQNSAVQGTLNNLANVYQMNQGGAFNPMQNGLAQRGGASSYGVGAGARPGSGGSLGMGGLY